MRNVLEDVTATLPEAKRTSTVKAEIASGILARAATGKRNPAALKIAGRRQVFALFSWHLTGTPRSLSDELLHVFGGRSRWEFGDRNERGRQTRAASFERFRLFRRTPVSYFMNTV